MVDNKVPHERAFHKVAIRKSHTKRLPIIFDSVVLTSSMALRSWDFALEWGQPKVVVHFGPNPRLYPNKNFN